MASLGLDIDNGDYEENYIAFNDLTEQGQKTTNAQIEIKNGNYTTAEGEFVTIPFNWEITARSLSYSWSGTQTVEVGGQSFDIPAIVFADPGDYSQYYEYVYTVDAVANTYLQLQEYMTANW